MTTERTQWSGFAQLAKYDEATGYFEAIAADESLDKSGEIFDYAKSKPHFEAWSSGIAKSTDGKSFGNVRAMHGKVAAGKLSEIVFDDEAKAIKVAGIVIDPVEKTKMASGVYTGVSIGGNYGVKWDDPVIKGAKRYEAIPTEISIVDLPCNSNAHFTVVKSDGGEELRKFVTAEPAAEPVAKDFTAQAERLAKHADAESAGNVIRAVLGMEQVEKGLWTVATFAEVLDQLSCITDCSDDEAAWEGDGSKVPAQLRAALKPLADAFLAMAAEEAAEAIAPASEVVEVLELAAPADDLAKGADDLAKAAEALQKVTAERDDLAKRLETVTKQYGELLTKAAPPKGLAKVVPVDKDTDAGHEELNKLDDTPVLQKDGSVDHQATALKLMKLAHRR